MLKPTIAISFLETFKDKNLDEIDMQIRHDAEIETGLSVDGLKEEEACSRLLSYIKESILSYDTEMVVYRNSHGCCNAFLSTALSKEDVDDFFFFLFHKYKLIDDAVTDLKDMELYLTIRELIKVCSNNPIILIDIALENMLNEKLAASLKKHISFYRSLIAENKYEFSSPFHHWDLHKDCENEESAAKIYYNLSSYLLDRARMHVYSVLFIETALLHDLYEKPLSKKIEVKDNHTNEEKEATAEDAKTIDNIENYYNATELDKSIATYIQYANDFAYNPIKDSTLEKKIKFEHHNAFYNLKTQIEQTIRSYGSSKRVADLISGRHSRQTLKDNLFSKYENTFWYREFTLLYSKDEQYEGLAPASFTMYINFLVESLSNKKNLYERCETFQSVVLNKDLNNMPERFRSMLRKYNNFFQRASDILGYMTEDTVAEELNAQLFLNLLHPVFFENIFESTFFSLLTEQIDYLNLRTYYEEKNSKTNTNDANHKEDLKRKYMFNNSLFHISLLTLFMMFDIDMKEMDIFINYFLDPVIDERDDHAASQSYLEMQSILAFMQDFLDTIWEETNHLFADLVDFQEVLTSNSSEFLELLSEQVISISNEDTKLFSPEKEILEPNRCSRNTNTNQKLILSYLMHYTSNNGILANL